MMIFSYIYIYIYINFNLINYVFCIKFKEDKMFNFSFKLSKNNKKMMECV